MRAVREARRLAPPAHVPLVSAFPAVFLLSENLSERPLPSDVALALSASVGGAFLAWLGLSRLAGRGAAGLIVSAGSVLFLLHYHIDVHVYRALEARSGLPVHWELVFLAAFAAGAAVLARSGRSLANPGRVAGAAAAAALLVPAAGIATHTADAAAGPGPVYPFEKAGFGLDPGGAPDVYYILPDSLGGARALEANLGHDSSGFVAALEGSGFRVAGDSFANYDATRHVLESVMSMHYVDSGPALAAAEAGTYDRFHVLDNSEVVENFKEMGYETYMVEGGAQYDYLDVDVRLCDTAGAERFLDRYAEYTMAGKPLFRYLAVEKIDERLCPLRELSRLAAEEGGPPRFVFAYVYLPHDPYVLDAGCGSVGLSMGALSGSRRAYLDQLECTESLLAGAAADLAAGRGPPVVIVQSDHGPRFAEPGADANFLSHYSILKAYHFPGVGEHAGFEASTPVNTFRILFNEYFGGSYELLEDEVRQSCRVPEPPSPGLAPVPVKLRPCHAGAA